jgi:hypothetical protein
MYTGSLRARADLPDRSWLCGVGLGLMFLALTGCGSEGPPPAPEPGAGPDAPPTEEERDRLARLYQSVNITIAGQEFRQLGLHPVQLAGDIVLYECFQALRKDPVWPFMTTATPPAVATGCDLPNVSVAGSNDGVPTFVTPAAPATCDQIVCQSQAALCVAHRLIELSDAVTPTTMSAKLNKNLKNWAGDPTYTLRGADDATVVIPPADAESAASLRETAFYYAAWAATLAGENLRKGANLTSTMGRCTAANLQGPTIKGLFYGDALASTLTEANVVAAEAAKGAGEAAVAVAEADYAKIPDVALASKVAWLDGRLSRARAAHVLVGGPVSEGLGNYRTPGSTGSADSASTLAFCPAAPLTGKDAEAMDVLRLAGPSPQSAADLSISFAALFESARTYPEGPDPALRTRLAERLGDPTIASMSAATFLAQRGLGVEHFLAARKVLAHEVKAFVRDGRAALPPLPMAAALVGGVVTPQVTTVPLYVATATEPLAPPALHYQTMARFPRDGIWFNVPTAPEATAAPGQAARPRVEAGHDSYSLKSLAALEDYSRIVAGEVLTSATPLANGALDILATFHGAEAGHIKGRMESCYRFANVGGTNRHDVRLRVYGSGLVAADHLIVVGPSGLRCAVEGSVEGANCNLADYAPSGAAVGGQGESGRIVTGPTLGAPPTESWVGFRDFVEWTYEPLTFMWIKPSLPLYIVRKKAGQPAAPGHYEAVAGYRWTKISTSTVTTNYTDCQLQPLDTDLERTVQTILTPSPESCGQAAATCAGTSVGDKIPLESELSDDGSAFESSWRVFLTRAKSAAQHADNLGEQLIESGLDMDRRIESSVESLATLCGTEVSLVDFFPANMAGNRGDPCPATQEGQACAPAGQVCRAGRCVVDPLALLQAKAATDPAAARLVQCLGGGGLVNRALGAKPMCVWRGKVTGRYCDPIAGKNCPYPAEPNGTCSTAGIDLTTYDVLAPAEPLELFSAPEGGGTTTEPVACSNIRKLRQGGLSSGDRKRLIDEALNTGFFSPDNVRSYAARLGWEAGPDDYSTVTFDGAALYETGTLFDATPEGTVWPCNGPAQGLEGPSCPAIGASEARPSLFCSYATCTSRDSRARMNQRLGRAVLALRILSGAGIGAAFRGPFLTTAEWMIDQTGANDGGWSEADVSSFKVVWPTGNSAGVLPSGVQATTASTLTYRMVEDDFPPNDDDIGELEVSGLAFCYNDNSSRPLWSDLPGPLMGSTKAFSAPCNSPGVFPMFKAYPSSSGQNPGPRVGAIWMGLDGQPLPPSPQGTTALVYQLLLSNDDPELLALAPVGQVASDLTAYWDDERAIAFQVGTVTSYADMNALKLARDGLHRRDVLDGLELMCEAARKDAPGLLESDCAPGPQASALSDLDGVEKYLRCSANEIRRRAEHEVFINMPKVAIDALQPGFQLEGELEAAAGDFASALVSFNNQELLIESVLASFAEDIKRLRIQLRQQQIAMELVNLNKLSAIANQTAACLSGVAEAGSVTGALGGKFGSAAVTCTNAAAQIGFALETAGLQGQNIELEGALRWVDYQAKFRGYGETLRETANQLTRDGAAMRAALARINDKREAGLRELSRAMMLGTNAAGQHFAVNTVMRRRYNTLLVRYQRAWRDAVKLAWIARRAIEQRLGLRLDDMHDDMLLVESPARWADALCTVSGIDYTRIRSENGLDADDFADEYLGDYVDKLDLVVASYEHDFPFHEGQDTAVVSLRDDVSLARRTCEVSAPNLLAYSARLDLTRDPETYTPVGFESPVEGGGSTAAPPGSGPAPVWTAFADDAASTAQVAPLDPAVLGNRPLPAAATTGGAVAGYRVTLNPAPTGATPVVSKPVAFAQVVHLTRGYYRLSWYGRSVTGGGLDAVNAVGLRPLVATAPAVQRSTSGSELRPGIAWPRNYHIARIETEGDYLVAVGSNVKALGPQQVDLAAVMLENVSALIPDNVAPSSLNTAAYAPGQFVATTAPGVTLAAVCEDRDGAVFRTKFRRGCEQLCPAGYGTCDDAPLQCFWEMPFDLNLEGIENGGQLAQAGFAHGNYNYRIENFSVNVVGTGVRDCSHSPLPTTCQANASVPFSLAHIGPYTVRNHKGEVYEAQLFQGRIEHGRGLAAERYITNPISSADRALLGGYEHHELRGRPLTGRYRIRIWDSDGVAFAHIEDVQVILDYRYWTRFE